MKICNARTQLLLVFVGITAVDSFMNPAPFAAGKKVARVNSETTVAFSSPEGRSEPFFGSPQPAYPYQTPYLYQPRAMSLSPAEQPQPQFQAPPPPQTLRQPPPPAQPTQMQPRQVNASPALTSSGRYDTSATTGRTDSMPRQGSYTPEQLGMFPMDIPTERIEGGNTLRTFKIPQGSDRVLYVVKSDGRPVKASVEMWLGPIRKTHAMVIDSEDGKQNPFRAVLKFKDTDSAGNQMLVIRNIGDYEFPLDAGMQVMSPARSKDLTEATQTIWKTVPRVKMQGGVVRFFPVPAHVDSVQVIWSSKGVGGKSTKAKVEVLQGPNNIKQLYDLHVSGGSQPYHAVFATPGPHYTLRIVSKQLLEFPHEIVVAPYEYAKDYTGPPTEIRPMGPPARKY